MNYSDKIDSPFQILRPSDLSQLLNLSKVSIWRMEKRGELPPRKKLSDSGRAVGWQKSDIEEWLENRPFADPEAEAERQSNEAQDENSQP